MFRVFKEFVKQDVGDGTKMRILSSQWIPFHTSSFKYVSDSEKFLIMTFESE